MSDVMMSAVLSNKVYIMFGNKTSLTPSKLTRRDIYLSTSSSASSINGLTIYGNRPTINTLGIETLFPSLAIPQSLPSSKPASSPIRSVRPSRSPTLRLQTPSIAPSTTSSPTVRVTRPPTLVPSSSSPTTHPSTFPTLTKAPSWTEAPTPSNVISIAAGGKYTQQTFLQKMIVVNASADVVITEGEQGGNNTYLIHPQANTTIVITDFKLSDTIDLRHMGMKSITFTISPYFTIPLPSMQSIVLRSFSVSNYDSRVIRRIVLGNNKGENGKSEESLSSALSSTSMILIITLPSLLVLFTYIWTQYGRQEQPLSITKGKKKKKIHALEETSSNYHLSTIPEKQEEELNESNLHLEGNNNNDDDSFDVKFLFDQKTEDVDS
eukprot:gene11739-12812_t